MCTVATVGLASCGVEFDFEREEYERGTLGEELFKIWKKDAERAPVNAEGKTQLLTDRKQDFITAVDTLAPPDKLGDVDQFFRIANKTIDNGVFQGVTRKTRIALLEAAEKNDVLSVLASESAHPSDSFVSPTIQPELIHHTLQYDRIREVNTVLLGSLLDSDGFDAKGNPSERESTEFLDLQRAIASSLKNAEPTTSEYPAAVSMRDILLMEDQRFHSSDHDVEIYAAHYDRRGYPMVAKESGGTPIFPFVDKDGDGMADVDAQGNFVMDGQPAQRVLAFTQDVSKDSFNRDNFGRATIQGSLAFAYVDLAETGLHFVLRQTAKLHEKRMLWDLLDGMPAALGSRTTHQDEFGSYQGYRADQPMIDMADAMFSTLDVEELPEILRALADFIDGNREELAMVLDAFAQAKKIIDKYPDAELKDISTIGYDLIPILEEIAKDPALWADVMDALKEPITVHFAEPIATMIRYRDTETVPAEMGAYEQCFQSCKSQWESQATQKHPHGIGRVGRYKCIRNCPTGELFSDKTDFNAPETPQNRSINAQTFQLLRDTAGQPYAMTIKEAKIAGIDIPSLPPLIKLDGSAEAFVRTIAGNLKMKNHVSKDFKDSTIGKILDFLGVGNGDVADLLSTMSGLFGTHLDPEPTPDQITRLFNQEDLKFEAGGAKVDIEDPTCRDEYVMANHHADKLFASEASGLIDTIQPLAKAFSDHNREDLLTQLYTILHYHNSNHTNLYKRKDGSPSPMKGAGLVEFEPALLEIAESGYLFEALHEFAVAMDRAKPVTGEPFDERLRQLVYSAVRSDGGYVGRDGQSTLKLPDGDTVQSPSRMHFMIDAIGRTIDRLDQKPQAKKKMTEVLKDFNDVFNSVEANGMTGEPAFETPGTLALLSYASRELAETAERWQQDGTFSQKLSGEWTTEMEEMMTSRTLPALIDIGRKISDSPEQRELANGLVTHLVGDQQARDQLAAVGHSLLAGSIDSTDWTPVAHFLGDLLDPAREWGVQTRRKLPLLSHLLSLLRQLVELDEGGIGIDMLRRGTRVDAQGDTAFGELGSVIGDYYRPEPASEADYRVADYRRVFSKLAEYLGDDVHGLEQMYDLIRQRSAAQ